MFSRSVRRKVVALVGLLALAAPAFSQKSNSQTPTSQKSESQESDSQKPGSFYWVDFHSPKDQSIVAWVTRALVVANWTSIREIGVKYDAALVVTGDRPGATSLPGSGTFNVWSVSLTTHQVVPLVKGVNLRWLAWLRLSRDAGLEPAVLYDNCRHCAANTYFTTFHYQASTHQWTARWTNNGQGVPVWNQEHPAGMEWTQVYAVMTADSGVSQLVTWNHFDYGHGRPPTDSIYSYAVDSFTGLDQSQVVSGKAAQAMKVALCSAQNAVSGLTRGQDSELCQQVLHGPRFRRPLRGVPERRLMPPHASAEPQKKPAPQHPAATPKVP